MWNKFKNWFNNLSRNRKIGLGVGVAIVLVVLASMFRGGASASNVAVDGLQTATIERGSLTASIGATGSVRAIQSATLVWETSGTVESVSVVVGDQVEQDDVLAELKLSSLPQNVILAHADLEAAQDELQAFNDSYGDLGLAEAQEVLANAQEAFERAQRNLYSTSNPGQQSDIDRAFANMILAEDQLEKARDDYEPYANKPENNLVRANYLIRLTEAQQAYDSAVRVYNSYANPSNVTSISVAQAELNVAQAELDNAQRELDKVLDGPTAQALAAAQARVAAAEATIAQAFISAPFDGVVTDAFPYEGDLVSTGTSAFQLDDLSHLLVDIDVSEVDINRVAIGQAGIITFDAVPDKEYHGEVVAVALAGTVDQGAVNFRVTLELSDVDEFVRPGMTAAVNVVVTELADVLLVPNRAVRVLNGERVIYLLKAGTLEPVIITLGASSETNSEILAGEVSEGDTIVLNPPANIFDPANSPGGGGFFGGGN
jgi:HlyD family secretion protein